MNYGVPVRQKYGYDGWLVLLAVLALGSTAVCGSALTVDIASSGDHTGGPARPPRPAASQL